MIKLISVLLLIALCSTQANAEPLRLVALQYPPYVYTEDNQVKGLATRMVRSIFDQLNVEIHIQILPWARALKALKNGAADGVFTIFKKDERLTYLHYPAETLIDQNIVFYARQDSPIRFDGKLESLYRHRIGLTRSVSYGSIFDAAKNQFSNSIIVNDEESKFELLARGRTELLISNQDAAQYYIDKQNLATVLRRLSPPLQSVPSYLALTKKPGHKELLKRFEQLLSRFKSTGQLQKIQQDWLAAQRQYSASKQ